MELRSRSAYILKCTIENEKGVPLKETLERLSITKRTFYYDLEKIEEWLDENSFGRIEIRSQVIHVVSDRMEELRMEMAKNTDYFFSIEERRTMEILFIALSPGAVTIGKMQKLFCVSKNTILSDVRKLKEILGKEQMTLISTIQTGYYITGEEFTIRKLISRQLQALENLHPLTVIKRQLQKSLEELSGQGNDYKEIARCLGSQYVRDVDIRRVTKDAEYECMMICVSWIRSMKGYVFSVNEDEKETLRNTGAFRSLKTSMENLKQYELVIPENEVYYITTLLLGIKSIEFSSQEAENLFVYRFTALLIRNYEQVACTTLADRERLNNQLRCHIRPLYYRLKYGLQCTSPLSEDIRRKYAETYEFVRRALRKITDELSVMITEEELAYLAIYFVSHEKQENQAEDPFSERPKILVICGEGMATSILVKEQLEEELGSIFQYEVKAAAEVSEEMLEKYELIVSTVYMEVLKKSKHAFLTSAFLTQKDKREIFRYVANREIPFKQEGIIQAIIEAVEKDTVGKIDTEQLHFDLFHILRGNRQSEKVKNRFIETMQRLGASCAETYQDWLEVVLDGCRKLLGGAKGEHLYERMSGILDSKTMNLYEIRPQVILVHCPLQGIPGGKIDSAVVVSKEAIRFLNGMEGRVFLFFSTVDSCSHFKILKNLYDYIDSPAGIRKIAGLKEEEYEEV